MIMKNLLMILFGFLLLGTMSCQETEVLPEGELNESENVEVFDLRDISSMPGVTYREQKTEDGRIFFAYTLSGFNYSGLKTWRFRTTEGKRYTYTWSVAHSSNGGGSSCSMYVYENGQYTGGDYRVIHKGNWTSLTKYKTYYYNVASFFDSRYKSADLEFRADRHGSDPNFISNFELFIMEY